MNLKLYFFIAMVFNFCFLAKTTGQILGNHNYKTESFKLNESALSERIKQLKYGREQKINLNPSVMKQGVSNSAELIAKNKGFDIYKLPLDNMLCLVPNDLYSLNMNSIKERFNKKDMDSNDHMPNPLERKELIPSNN